MSQEYQITVDVYAQLNVQDRPPRYRIYLDDELFAERDFGFHPYSIFIREHLVANLTPGKHTLFIENIVENASVRVRNICINGKDLDAQGRPIKEEFYIDE